MRNVGSGNSIVPSLMVILLVFLVAFAAVAGTYSWQQGRVNSLNAKIKNLNSQVSTLSSKLSQACQPTQQTNPTCISYEYMSAKGIPVLIYSPIKNSTVTNPVAIIGEVPGNWSTEAQFPVQLKDDKGNIVAQAPAHVLGNWQTTQLVPFSVQLTFTTTESGSGTLVLQKDNPSGLPQNSDFVSIPIKL